MTQHNYTHTIDMSDSSAFYQGFYDDVEKVLFLTFKNGTTSTRRVDPTTTPEDVEEIDSWGSLWWTSLINMPEGPRVAPGDEFVYREPAVEEESRTVQADPAGDDSDAWAVFSKELRKNLEEWGDDCLVEDYEEELKSALNAALSANSEPTEAGNAQSEPEGLADAVRNSEGTFIGIGFVDVPEAMQQRLLSTLGFVNEFVQEQVGEVKSLVEQYDVSTMRNFFRGLR